MKVQDILQLSGYEKRNAVDTSREVEDGYTSDLLSDVMANAPENSVLITIQAHKNTVAVAGLAGISAVVLCNGREAPADMIEAAEEENILIISTKESQFRASVRIGNLLDTGRS